MAHPTLWTGENWSRIAGAGRSHRVDKEHDNLCFFIAELDKVDYKSSFMQLKVFNTQMQKSIVFSVAFFDE